MKQKILLPNGCYCSEPRISPQSAYNRNASTREDWCIQYRFYDPGNTKDGKIIPYQVVFKGMNEYKSLADRRAVCKQLIENELQNLRSGYNPRNKSFDAFGKSSEIDPTTGLIQACELARNLLKCSDPTKEDIKSCLVYVKKSAIKLNLQNLQISQVRRKHVSLILNNCRNVKEYWSPHLFNHYRAYLMMLFKKMIELEAIESNPVDEYLPKEIVATPPRKTLNNDQVKKILEHFKDDHYYLRFIHIFFHSGARPVELLRLKTGDVNLDAGTFTLTNKKGNKIRLQEKPIKKIALQYWEDLMNETAPGDYLFGSGDSWGRGFKNGLKPGKKPALRDYVTKKWNREVKGKLEIDIDMYSLKHKNLDEIAAYLSIHDAQRAAGHESPVITMVYAVGEAKRQRDKYASVPNALGGG